LVPFFSGGNGQFGAGVDGLSNVDGETLSGLTVPSTVCMALSSAMVVETVLLYRSALQLREYKWKELVHVSILRQLRQVFSASALAIDHATDRSSSGEHASLE